MLDRAPCPYPFGRTDPLTPPSPLADLRREPLVPVTLPSGDEAVLVTRYHDVRRLLLDDRLSRNLVRHGAARITTGNSMFQNPAIDPDPPEHTRVRRLVAKAFTAARVEALRPHVQAVADELVADMRRRGAPADLGEAFSFPLPIRVMCLLLGVPERDHARFRGWTDAFLSLHRYPPEHVRAAMGEMVAYIAGLIEEKRRRPADDLVSELIAVRDTDDGRLTDLELQWWCRLLLLVGYETTATQISGAMAVLLRHPEQLAALRADPTLVPGAVEETLRWKLVGSSVSMLRYATEDIELDDCVIPAGTSVIPAVDSANLDASVFDRPDEFDVGRTENRHLTFSVGAHHCIGSALARAELEVAVTTLLDAFPTLRLDVPAEALQRHEGSLLEGFDALPVTW